MPPRSEPPDLPAAEPLPDDAAAAAGRAPGPRPPRGRGPGPSHARPWTTSLKLLVPLAAMLALLAALIGLAAWGGRWLLHTEAGARWLLGRLPMVEVRDFQGALLGDRWRAARLQVSWAGGREWIVLENLRADGLRWHWRPDSGRWLALEVEQLAARRVEAQTGPPGPRPIPLPPDLQAPLSVEVKRLDAEELVVDDLRPVTRLSASGLLLDGRAGAAHGVERFSAEAYGVRVQAAVTLANQAPFRLEASATAVPAPAGDEPPPWAAVLQARGPLAGFVLTGVLRGRPPQAPGAAPAARAPGATSPAAPSLDLRATVRPLEAWPVRELSARTAGLDLSSLVRGAPQTRLEGEFTLQAAARDAPMRLLARLENRLPGRWNEGRVPASHVEADLTGTLARRDRIDATRLVVQFADARSAAGRLTGRASWQGHRLEIDAALAGLSPQHLDTRASAMMLDGPVKLTLDGLPSPDPAAGTAAPPLSVQGKLALEGRFEGAPMPVKLGLEGQGSAAGVELREVQAEAGAARARLHAKLARAANGDWTLATAGQVTDFDPLPWWPGAPDSTWRRGPHRFNADWQLDLRLPKNAGALAPVALAQSLAGNGNVHLHDSVLAGVPLTADVAIGYTPAAAPASGSLRADMRIAGNRLLVEGRGEPTGSGEADRWRGELAAPALASLAPLARLDPALAGSVPREGSINATFAADGRWPRLATHGEATIDRLRIGTAAVQRAEATWSLDLAALQGEASPLSLQASARGLTWGTGAAEQRAEQLRVDLRGTLAAHRIELAARLPLAPPPMAERVLGLAAGRGSAEATLKADGAWRAEAAGGGRWRARVEQLDIGPAAAAAAAPSSSASSAATATAANASGPASAAAPAAARWAQARDLSGELTVDREGRLVAITAEPGRVRIAESLGLRWDAVQVDLRRDIADFELKADIDSFAAAPLLARLQPTMGWEGDLRLAARVTVRARERFEADMVAERVSGDLHLASGGELQLLGLTELRLALTARDGLWELVPRFAGRSLGDVQGRIRVRTGPERRWPEPDAALEGRIEAHVADVGIWSAWVPPGWRLTGELRTLVALGGRVGEPTYTGELSGNELGVRNLLQGVNVAEGRLLVRLAGDNAQIEHFTLRGGDGQLELTGSAAFGTRPSAKVHLRADRFRVLGRVDRLLTASGDADLAFDADGGRLDGRLRVDEGLFDFSAKDAPSLDDDVTVRGKAEADAAAAAEAAARPKRNFNVALDVDLGNGLRARGRGVDTQLRGQVRITNPAGRLAVIGTINSERGTYAAYGQKLEIERGILAFAGPVDNPRVDVLALRPNLDIRVGVQVVGPLQSLRVRLYSEPEMAESDKLSWMVLGRASEGLGRNDTAILQRAAVALLAGEGETPTDALMQRLGIDELSLKQGDGDVRETVVSLGKQLSRRWYVGYERGVNATTGTWQLIYRVAQRFTLRAQSGLQNSLDLIWTWRFQEPPADTGVRKSLPVPP